MLACNTGRLKWTNETDQKDIVHKSLRAHTIPANSIQHKTAPATLQWVMDVILWSIEWQSVLVYLGDIVVSSKFANNQKAHLGQVLKLFLDARNTLKLKTLILRRVDQLLGGLYRTSTTGTIGRKKRSRTNTQKPATQAELRSFFCHCNVLSSIVASALRVTAVLVKKIL